MNEELRKLIERIHGKEVVAYKDIWCVCGHLIERGYTCYRFKRGEYLCTWCHDSFEMSPDKEI